MSPAAGTQFANAVIRSVAEEPYIVGSIGPLQIGISIGFACVPEDGLAGDDLHRKADAALYEAKAAGRGTHRRFRTSVDSPPKAEAKPTLRAGTLLRAQGG
jgi:GGDEF domain-containing protein